MAGTARTQEHTGEARNIPVAALPPKRASCAIPRSGTTATPDTPIPRPAHKGHLSDPHNTQTLVRTTGRRSLLQMPATLSCLRHRRAIYGTMPRTRAQGG
jgi:hypothetical protein